MSIANTIQRILRPAGYDLRHYKPLRSDPYVVQATLCPNAAIVYDIGAFRGQTALQYAALFPQARVYAVEPFPESFKLLPTTSRITPLNAAIGAAEGVVTFHVNGRPETNSLLPRTAGSRYFAEDANAVATIQVPAITIDRLATEHGPPDIIKLDVQGAELLAIAGAVKTLTESAPSLIYTEVNFVPHYEGSALFGGVLGALGAYGYTLFGLYDLHHAANGQIRFGDALFVSPALRALLDAKSKMGG